MFDHPAVDLPKVLVPSSFSLPSLTFEMTSEFIAIIINMDLPRLSLLQPQGADHLPGFYFRAVEARSSTGRHFHYLLVVDTSFGP